MIFNKMLRKDCLLISGLAACFLSCRGELPGVDKNEESLVEDADTTGVVGESTRIKGFFLLNEGNMGSNKATLDFFDATTGIYKRNIYPSRNPHVVKELGDVGNDLAIYGSKLYAVINGSHLLEIMDAATARHLGKIDIANCRYIAFHKGYAYVSSYAGPIQISPEKRPGKIVEIDTATMKITREVIVGFQPEEMVVDEGKLYVANSGGYQIPDYDHTISVIDLASFQVTDIIDVAINLHRMELASDGIIYVSSRGDNKQIASDVYLVDPKQKKVIGRVGKSVSDMAVSGDSLFMVCAGWNNKLAAYQHSYVIFDTQKRQVVNENMITDGTDAEITIPYGIAVHPVTKDIYITDATNYVTPGYLFCLNKNGQKKWKVRTGDIPSRIVFTETVLK